MRVPDINQVLLLWFPQPTCFTCGAGTLSRLAGRLEDALLVVGVSFGQVSSKIEIMGH